MKKYLLGLLIFCLGLSSSHAQTVLVGAACDGNPSVSNTTNMLFFGPNTSGERIFSNKVGTSIGNINGLDFTTNYIHRIRITNTGNVTIGNYATPTTKLSFGPYSAGDAPMRLSVFDNGIRFGVGYFEETAPFKRVFSFHVSDPTQSRFGFFDNYTSGNANGTEFVTFNAANKSVGIGSTDPVAKLHIKNSTTTLSMDAHLVRIAGTTNNYLRIGLGYYNNKNIEINGLDDGGTGLNHIVLQGDNNSGNLGVGRFGSILSPQSKLHVNNGHLQISNGDLPIASVITPAVAIASKRGIFMGYYGAATAANTDYAWIQSSTGPLVLNPNAGNSLTTTPNTNNFVSIGYTPAALTDLNNMAGYNLFVQGKVMCEELKIKIKGASWYDHVLQSDYKLMTLDSLATYIAENSHLPDIPSAAEVEKNGIMAGEMNGLLLKKVEELTLYMIQQNNLITEQAKALTNQENQLTGQNEQIALLKEQNRLVMQQIELLLKK